MSNIDPGALAALDQHDAELDQLVGFVQAGLEAHLAGDDSAAATVTDRLARYVGVLDEVAAHRLTLHAIVRLAQARTIIAHLKEHHA